MVSKISNEDGRQFRKGAGVLSGFVLDSLRGLKEIIQYGMGQKRLMQMNEQTEALSGIERTMKDKQGTNAAITNTVIWVFDFILLMTAAYLYGNGVVGFEGVLLPVLAIMGSFGPVVALAALGSTLGNTFAAGNRVLDILEEEPVVEEIKGKADVVFGGIKVENVDFSYEETKILDGFCIEIPKGRIVGITGKSGSGKSTLLKLLMRFRETDAGKIEISQTDIRKINTVNLRDHEISKGL